MKDIAAKLLIVIWVIGLLLGGIIGSSLGRFGNGVFAGSGLGLLIGAIVANRITSKHSE